MASKRRGPTVAPKAIDDLVADALNANRGTDRGRALVESSIRSYGAGRSILVDRKGRIIAGHKTVNGAKAAGLTKTVVVPTTGDTLVVVQREDLDLDLDAKARALGVVDNRASEVGLEWSPDMLQAIAAAGTDLTAVGFSSDELVKLFGREEKDGEGDPDAAIAPRATKIKPGQMFALGRHRLICGDSTDPAVVTRVMEGATGVIFNTDAPYGVDYVKTKKGIPGFRVTEQDIENDELNGAALQAFLELSIRAALPHLSPRCAFYFWHPMLTQGTFFAAAAAAADIAIHRQIIWIKPHMVLTRSGMYHWQHELCFYGWVRGKMPPWYGDKAQTSVWTVGRDDDSGQHPTQKPIELFARPMRNHARAGEHVYEPFAGSGSQVLAGETLDVAVHACEIDPSYCQVIIDRWERFSGQRASRVGGSRGR